MGMLRAEEYHFLRAVDIRMFCRPRPGAAATLQERVLPGEKILVAGQALVGTTSWYNDGFRTLTNRDCWLYRPGTVEFNEEQPGPGWVVMLDHVLARNDVTFEEYVDVDNALQAADSPQDRKAIDDLSKWCSRRTWGTGHYDRRLGWGTVSPVNVAVAGV